MLQDALLKGRFGQLCALVCKATVVAGEIMASTVPDQR